uniref:phytanoyl-CoA dioxygenase n=1 Tax=Caenorhabditis tropicalis TaxID=1561998 RepID=A0A1I7U7Y0_9PELO
MIAENRILEWNTDGIVVSKEQKQFYLKNGYVVLPKLIDQRSIDVYTQRFQDICSGKCPKSSQMVLMRDIVVAKKGETTITENNLNKITNFMEDDVLWDYCQQPKIINGVKDLIGRPDSCILAMNTMVINKPPDFGKLSSRHPLHQDLHYFPFRPSDFICCAWTAMERITRSNGCLVVVPGSHLGPLLEHGYPEWDGNVNSAYHGIKDYSPDLNMVHLEMDTGDTVFFSPLLIHGSGYRKAITAHFANDDYCRYLPKDNPEMKFVMEDFDKIIEKFMKKKGFDGSELSFHDFWAVRAKEICGVRSNL